MTVRLTALGKAFERIGELETERDNVLDAYKELWGAVENDDIKNNFFELREKFRKIMEKS